MPGNKRPNRKPGKKNSTKRIAADKNLSGVDNAKGGKSVAKTYGPKPSRSPISPVMNRGSARNR